MPEALLTTKLYVPQARTEVVAREHLYAQLQAALCQRLVLVVAPAGSGKTTLLAEWVRSAHVISAWVSLDPDDNDPRRFMAYVAGALAWATDEAAARIHPPDALSASPVAAVVSRPDLPGEAAWVGALLTQQATAGGGPGHTSGDAEWTQAVATGLINELAELREDIVLVLDDYHLMTNPAIHQAVSFLLDHAPPRLHVLIAARSMPPLPLSRLRGRGELTELRFGHLQFTLAEASEFLNRSMRLDLEATDVALLWSRCEGWVVGLQLAALSMRGSRDLHRRALEFAGSEQYIMDYLTDEVLSRLPEPVLTFLLQTSILDHLSGPLCDAVTGRTDGREMLEALERDNLFLAALDGRRQWYRYHHLFVELLRSRLDRSTGQPVADLHRRASEWYAKNGRLYEAMEHALATGDFEWAGHLVEQADATMVMQGEVSALLRWFDALPASVVQSRPRLLLSSAWALFFSARIEAIEPRVQEVLRALGISPEHARDWPAGVSAEMEAFLAEIGLLQAWVALYRGETLRAIELARQARSHGSALRPLHRSAAAFVLADAYRDSDQITAASEAYAEAMRGSGDSGHPLMGMVIADDLARLRVVQGKLHEAAEGFRRVLAEADERWRPFYPVGQALVGLGDLLREWDDLDGAEDHLIRGVSQCELGGYARYSMVGYASMARVRAYRGDAAGALSFLDKAERQAGSIGSKFCAEAAAARARLCLLALGDVAAASRWAESCGLGADDDPEWAREMEYLVLARVLMARARAHLPGASPESVSRLLSRVMVAANKAGRNGSVIEISILEAQAFHIRGDATRSMVAMERALSLAEPEGYVHLFVDEGAPMIELLRQAAARGVLPSYCDRLLGGSGAGVRPPAQLEPLPGTLTGRELEVLRLIAAGLANAEIARELNVTVRTVKAHSHAIFAKLGVQSRTQAAARARDRRLL